MRSEISLTAVELAMLPPVAPPIPSQTTAQATEPGNSPAAYESSLEVLFKPISVFATILKKSPTFLCRCSQLAA